MFGALQEDGIVSGRLLSSDSPGPEGGKNEAFFHVLDRLDHFQGSVTRTRQKQVVSFAGSQGAVTVGEIGFEIEGNRLGTTGVSLHLFQNWLKRSRMAMWERLLVAKIWVAKTEPSVSTTTPMPVWVHS